MRKFLGSAFGLSLIGSLALGAAFAWSTTGTGSFSNEMGTISISVPTSMAYTTPTAPQGNIVYDGAGWIPVSLGGFTNTTPANPGVNLHLTGGNVTVEDIVPTRGCQAWMQGKVDINPDQWATPGGGVSGTAWVASLRIDGSPDACQGAQVNYFVNLIAGT